MMKLYWFIPFVVVVMMSHLGSMGTTALFQEENEGQSELQNAPRTTTAPSNPSTTFTLWEDITFDNFEGGRGNFDVNREDVNGDYTAGRMTSPFLSPRGVGCLFFMKNSSVFLRESHDVTGCSNLLVHFWFRSRDMEDGDAFSLDYSSDGGSTYQLMERFVVGMDFPGETVVEGTVDFDSTGTSYEMTSEARIRFRGDEGNEMYEEVFIDDVSFRCLPITSQPSMSSSPSTSSSPSISTSPSTFPTTLPTTSAPTTPPTAVPTDVPSTSPTTLPTTSVPTASPTALPTMAPTREWEEITHDDFETGFGDFAKEGEVIEGFTGAGKVCPVAPDGRLVHSISHSVSSYDQLRVNVTFSLDDFPDDTGGRLVLEYSSDDGNEWGVVKRFNYGNPFLSGPTYTKLVYFTKTSDQAKIRFRSKAKAVGDYYGCIHDVKFEGLPLN